MIEPIPGLPEYLFYEIGDPIIVSLSRVYGIVTSIDGDRELSIKEHTDTDNNFYRHSLNAYTYFGYTISNLKNYIVGEDEEDGVILKKSLTEITKSYSGYCYEFSLNKSEYRNIKLNNILDVTDTE